MFDVKTKRYVFQDKISSYQCFEGTQNNFDHRRLCSAPYISETGSTHGPACELG